MSLFGSLFDLGYSPIPNPEAWRVQRPSSDDRIVLAHEVHVIDGALTFWTHDRRHLILALSPNTWLSVEKAGSKP